MPTCCVKECDAPVRTRGHCNKHYQRLLKHGDAQINLDPKDVPIEQRFWSKVDKSGECWIWTAALDGNGYGEFRIGGRVEYSHRVAYSLANNVHLKWDGYGAKSSVCHRCDNPSCVRPDHLFLGTHRDNMADMNAKNRRKSASGDSHWSRTHPESIARGDKNGMRKHPESVLRGSKNGSSKIDEETALAIKEAYAKGNVKQKDLAAKYGVDVTTISCIVRGKIWRHVALPSNPPENIEAVWIENGTVGRVREAA